MPRQVFSDASGSLLKRLRDVDLGFWGLRATLERLERSPETLGSTRDVLDVLSACQRVGDWALAWRFFRRLRHRFPEVIISNAYMSTCTELSAWQCSLNTYSYMDWAWIERDVVTCNTALDTLGKRHFWPKACALLESWRSMRSAGLQCDVVSYNSLAGSCKPWQRTLQVASLLCREHGLEPDQITETSLNAAYAAESLWQRATAGISGLSGTSSVSWNVLANAAAKAQAWEKATLLDSLCQLGVDPDTISFNTGISAFERNARWTYALQFFQSLGQFSVRANSVTLNSVSSACASSNAWEWTLTDLRYKKIGKSYDIFSCSACVSACSSSMEWELAVGAMCMARKWNALSQPLLSAGLAAYADRWAQMFDLLSSWRDAGGQVASESFNAAFQVCYQSHQWPSSLILLSQMQLLQVPVDSTGSSCFLRQMGHTRSLEAWKLGLSFERWRTPRTPHSERSRLKDDFWSSFCWSCEAVRAPSPGVPQSGRVSIGRRGEQKRRERGGGKSRCV